MSKVELRVEISDVGGTSEALLILPYAACLVAAVPTQARDVPEVEEAFMRLIQVTVEAMVKEADPEAECVGMHSAHANFATKH